MSSPVVIPKADSLPNNVIPTSGVMPLNTLDDWRAMFHQAVPIIVTALVGTHLVTESTLALIIPFVFAIADPLLSVGNTKDKARKIIYALIAVLQAGSALTAIIEVAAQHSSPVVAPIIMVVGSIISGFLGRAFTPTSTVVPIPVAKVVGGPDIDSVL